MIKPYCAILFLLSLVCWGNVYAQKPNISYVTPQIDTVGKTSTPVSPKNTGGAIPIGFYTQTTTLAGEGVSGDVNGNIKAATFGSQMGIAEDASGDIYIADANNNVIRKITPNGIVSNFAGGVKGYEDAAGPSAKFNQPTGVTCDAQGNIYVADYGNNMIRRITPGGVVTTLAGSGKATDGDGTGTSANFNLPYGLVYNVATNAIIVADTYNNEIRQVTMSGVVTTIAGKAGAGGYADGVGTSAQFNKPYGVAVDAAGNIYVADTYNNKIRKIDNTGNVTTLSSSSLAGPSPHGITVDNFGNVYVTSQTPVITKISSSGQASVLAGNAADSTKVAGIGTAARFGKHGGITYDPVNGGLLVADGGNYVIRDISLTGYEAITPALPHGLRMDSTGTISGKPDSISPLTNYRIVAYNKTDSCVAIIGIRIVGGHNLISFLNFPSKTYGDPVFSAGVTSNNSDVPITYVSSNPKIATIQNDSVKIVGAGTVSITASQAANNNYSAATPVSRILKINKSTLTVTANDQYRLVGDANPTLSLSYKTFAYKDSAKNLIVAPVATTTATAGSKADTYPITVSGGLDSNYTFTYVPGTLTIQAIPTIIANGSTAFIEGGSVRLTASPNTGYAYQWLKNGTPITGDTTNSIVATTSGVYTVSLSLNAHSATAVADTVVAAFKLSPENFRVLIKGSSCQGTNNGSIYVNTLQPLKYTATLNGNGISASYLFSDTLTINNIAPGTYNICFTVDSEAYQQCFAVNITQPQDLSVYSTVNVTQKTVSLQLGGSENVYNITLNNKSYTTTDSVITLPLENGDNKLSVTTGKLCQGVIDKDIVVSGDITAYPNPFQDILNVNIGNAVVKNIDYNLYSLANGKLVYSGQNNNQSGMLRLDLSGIADGIYYLKLNLDSKKSSFKIIKK